MKNINIEYVQLRVKLVLANFWFRKTIILFINTHPNKQSPASLTNLPKTPETLVRNLITLRGI